MRNGFKFKDRHSNEFGVTVRTKSRPIIPSVKAFTADLPYRDGEYDFSASNPQCREHFYSRIFTISLTVTANNLSALQSKISKLSLWLHGSGDLIFDDIPLIVWRGKISDEVIYMPEHGGKVAQLEVSFRVNPFGKNIFGTEGAVLDTPIRIGDAVPLTLSEKYIYTVTRSGEVNVINFGDRPIRPQIKIDGSAGNVTMTLGDKSLAFTAGGSVTVDFDKQTVTNKNGSVKVMGEFFEFNEGGNMLKITNSNSNTLTVTAEFTPEYMYGVDFAEDKWGDGNA